MTRTSPIATLTGRMPTFPLHFERSVQRVRGALTDLLTGVDADPEAPQVLARRFGLNKNLAWKVCRIVGTSEPEQVVPLLPGPAGFEILFEALQRSGAAAELVEGARSALADFDQMVTTHAGDRAGLELMLGSMEAGTGQSAFSENARRLAFQGNSAIFGVQAKARIGAQLLAPSTGAEHLLDVAILGGMADFRRLRPTAVWPLAQRMQASEVAQPGFRIEPIDPAFAAPDSPPFVGDHCSKPLPDVRCMPIPGGTSYELGEGPVGNTASQTCVFGWILRRFASVHREEEDSVGEYFLRLNVPAERVLFDLLVHRDLPFVGAPELDFYSLMQGRMAFPLSAHRQLLLPRMAAVEALGEAPPVLSTQHFARQGALLETAARSLGHRLEDFRGYRLSMSFPPIPTMALFHYQLPEKPASLGESGE